MNIITESLTWVAVEGKKLKWKPHIGKNWSAFFPFLSGACLKLIYWKDWWQHRDCGTSPGLLCNALKWLGNIGHLHWSRLFVLPSQSCTVLPASRTSGHPAQSHLVPLMAQEPSLIDSPIPPLPWLRAEETSWCICDDQNLIIYQIDFQLQL